MNTIFPFIRLTGLIILLFFLNACSETSKREPELSEDEACAKIKALIADHSTDFSTYKRSLRRTQTMNTWSAIKAFPSAQDCKIWEWADGRYNYICNWPSRKGRESAMMDYELGNDIVMNCLGPSWDRTIKPTKSGGENTLYFKPGLKTIVAVRFLREARRLMEKWQTVVIIGDRNNTGAKLQ